MQETKPNYMEFAIWTVLMIHHAEDEGDMLLFLAREEEIEEMCHKIQLEPDDFTNWNSESVGPLVRIPLTPSSQEQQQRFDAPPAVSSTGSSTGQNVGLSTNITEMLLKINGIVYVVDPGFLKQKVYNLQIHMESLLISPISKVAS